ncbi:hypothetical protein VTO73DRAFT_9663 [Trametes versicolor]
MHFNTHASSADLQLPAHQDSDLAALQTTSQHPDTDTLSMNMHPRVKISLSRPQDAVCHSEAPATYPDTRVLYGEAVDGPQTVQRLVMRKRTTSPYQIKLPFMEDRLRARRSTSGSSVPEVIANPQPSGPETEDAFTRVGPAPFTHRAKTSSPLDGSFSLDHNARVFMPPSQCVTVTAPQGETRTSIGGPTASEPPSAEDVFPPFILHTLPTLDTWSEICEDLSRAMEVFTVLANVAPARFLVPPSQTFSVELPPPCSFQSHKLDRSPATPASPWNSFVFPCFGVV